MAAFAFPPRFLDAKGPAWTAALLFTAFIYLTLSPIRGLTEFLRARGVLGAVVASIYAVIGVSVLFIAVFLLRERRPSAYAALAAIAAAAGVLMARMKFPEERVHFAEYGFLACLLFNALRHNLRGWALWACAALLTAGFGWLDELIQLVMPDRVYDLKDVALNAVGGIIGLSLVFVLGRGKRLRPSALVPAAVLFIACGAVSCAKTPAGPPGKGRYNFLVLTADSLRPDHMGCYGYGRRTTPNIDRLCAGAFRFTNARTNAQWTSPAIVSLFTSLHPPVHGVERRGVVLNPSAPAIGRLLAATGYSAFGYNHEGDNYENMGFSRMEGDRNVFLTLRAHSKESFLVWEHLKDVHLPYDPPRHFAGMFLRNPLGDARLERLKPILKEPMMFKEYGWKPLPEDREAIEDLYDGDVRMLDSSVGLIIEELDALRLSKSTVIVLLADHGEELLEHGYVGHASTSRDTAPWEPLLRIPLVVKVPGMKGGEISTPVEIIDVAPTIAELAGAAVPAQMQGRSLVRLMEGKASPGKGGGKLFFSASSPCGWQCAPGAEKDRYYSVTDGSRKLIRRTEADAVTDFFFDLAADPSEQANMAAGGLPSETELESRLESWLSDCVEARGKIGEPAPYAQGEGR